MLNDSELGNELDRVAAAVGVRIVRAGVGSSVSRRTWSAAVAVVLDQAAAVRCGESALPRRGHVSVLTAAEPTTATWAAAIAVGARHVLQLPVQERELIHELGEAAEAARDRGPRGRSSPSSVAAAAPVLHCSLSPSLTRRPTRRKRHCWWTSIRGAAAPICWWAPKRRPVCVGPILRCRADGSTGQPCGRHSRDIGESTLLSGTRRGYELDAAPVDAVVDAGRRGGVTVVCDLPRRLTDATQTALDTADLVVLVSPCDVRACAATGSIAPVLATINPHLGLVVRGPSPGGLRALEVADIAGLPLLASMKAEPQLAGQLERGGLRLRRRSALATAARQVLALLPVQNGRAA